MGRPHSMSTTSRCCQVSNMCNSVIEPLPCKHEVQVLILGICKAHLGNRPPLVPKYWFNIIFTHHHNMVVFITFSPANIFQFRHTRNNTIDEISSQSAYLWKINNANHYICFKGVFRKYVMGGGPANIGGAVLFKKSWSSGGGGCKIFSCQVVGFKIVLLPFS